MRVMLTKKLKMFNKKTCLIAMLAFPLIGFAQQKTDTIAIQKLMKEVNVNALRAGEKTPVAFTFTSFTSFWIAIVSVFCCAKPINGKASSAVMQFFLLNIFYFFS